MLMFQSKIKGPHKRFDIPPDKVLQFKPTALIGNMLSMINLEFSSIQMGHILQLILGLDFHHHTQMMETVCAERLTMPWGIFDLNVHYGLAGLGHKGTI
jgi:hypothetical protein